MALQSGDRLGPYTIQALLGVGGMGEVYRGRDTRLGRDVALKVISPKLVGDPSLRRRFELEARAASVLNHPCIVTVYDVGDSEGVSWIAMSRVPSLKVMARATVFRFKGTADPQEAGRRLGVGAVVTGTVSRRGNQLSISAELVEIATGARLWGETYDRPFADLLRVQDTIASDISETRAGASKVQDQSRLAPPPIPE